MIFCSPWILCLAAVGITISCTASESCSEKQLLRVKPPSYRISPMGPSANHSMLYRPLGRSGLRVSAISYGAWLTVSQTGSVHLEKHVEILRAAILSGINFIDNAEVYGAFPGESEYIMGRALQQLFNEDVVQRSDLVISTKIFDGGNGVNDRGLSRKHVLEATLASLKRMRLDYVDLLFCHRSDGTTPLEEIVRAMNHILDRGLALYWGTSEWTSKDLHEAHAIAARLGLIAPVMEQPLYNLFNRARVESEYKDLYPLYGLGLTVYSPLAEGILAGRYSQGALPLDSRAALVGRKASLAKEEAQIKATQMLVPIAEKINCSLAQLALAWVLHNPHVSTAIIGASKSAQILENVGAIQCLLALQEEDIALMEKIISESGAEAPFDPDISTRMANKKLASVGRGPHA